LDMLEGKKGGALTNDLFAFIQSGGGRKKGRGSFCSPEICGRSAPAGGIGLEKKGWPSAPNVREKREDG